MKQTSLSRCWGCKWGHSLWWSMMGQEVYLVDPRFQKWWSPLRFTLVLFPTRTEPRLIRLFRTENLGASNNYKLRMNFFLDFFSILFYIAYRALGSMLGMSRIDGTSDHARNCIFNFCPGVIYGIVYLVKSKVVLSLNCPLRLDGNSFGPSFLIILRRFHRLEVFKLHLLILVYELTPQGFLWRFLNASRHKNLAQTLILDVGIKTSN